MRHFIVGDMATLNLSKSNDIDYLAENFRILKTADLTDFLQYVKSSGYMEIGPVLYRQIEANKAARAYVLRTLYHIKAQEDSRNNTPPPKKRLIPDYIWQQLKSAREYVEDNTAISYNI